MLTPAEEMGLSGMQLAGRVRRAFYRLPAQEVRELTRSIRDECSRRRVVYLRDGAVETIRLLACPIAVMPDQVAYLHYVSLTIQNALKRFPEMYMRDFAVREILRLPPAEEQWLWGCWGPSHQESNPIFGRLDAVVDFSSPMWKESLRFVEPNMSGIGGLHLVPTSERILAELVFPLLRQADPELRLEVGQDIRELLMQEVLDHLESIRRSVRTICFLEPKYAASGIDEQDAVARYFHDRHGLRVVHADPRELELRADGEVYGGGERIDVAYRDYTVTDLLELEASGSNVEPMRRLFQTNRMVSSIAAELDQKSCWHVLTDPEITQRYFGPEERHVFRRHILWTRILEDREASLPDGHRGNLLEFARLERERLVLKPNRSYGGDRVLIGLACEAAQWDAALDAAVAPSADRWVVQQLAGIPVNEFPIIDETDHFQLEPFYTVMGFAPSKYGIAILGRASQKQVVNVAQRGGICVIAVGHPPMRLQGPERA
ncbi:MAG: hypothetical protein FJ297_15045 [Planctomycetes bacterium]|nr:hypothetical protein [Planctomycetota bacterium]